jgi:stage II sporulation protein P
VVDLFRRTIRGYALSRYLSVAVLSFFCVIGWGIGESPSLEQVLAFGLAGPESGEFGSDLAGTFLVALSGVDPWYPPDVLKKGLPRSADWSNAVAVAAQPLEEPAERGLSREGMVEEDRPCEVAIYHTHNAETYIPLHGKSKVEGENGAVSAVGKEIASCLEQEGIKVIHDLTIHDYPDFPTSYIKSEVTARRLVSENPELKVLMDIHRDAGIPRKETVFVNGEESARIMLVVSNGRRLPNPHWQENYAFAQRIANLLEEKYPGIVKGVRLKDGRYNQHVSPRAILVEVGSDKNTLQEGLVAARCLASVLAELIRDEGLSGG